MDINPRGSANMMNDAPDGTWSTIIPVGKLQAHYNDAIYLEEVGDNVYLEEADEQDGTDVPPTSGK